MTAPAKPLDDHWELLDDKGNCLMSISAKPPPDYWVVKYGASYLTPANDWLTCRRWARRFTSQKAAEDALEYDCCYVIAVRRKPSVRKRIAELVTRCKAAIDEYRHNTYPRDAFVGHAGGRDFVVSVERILVAIDPAAAAEIRAYWEPNK
jgi:hypothetical protein